MTGICGPEAVSLLAALGARISSTAARHGCRLTVGACRSGIRGCGGAWTFEACIVILFYSRRVPLLRCIRIRICIASSFLSTPSIAPPRRHTLGIYTPHPYRQHGHSLRPNLLGHSNASRFLATHPPSRPSVHFPVPVVIVMRCSERPLRIETRPWRTL